ncbi:MAG: beta-N-acetylglucosaminidase domain-containing protein, partial [Selenomonadaceae bacterium]|nr:beta-N-acetylglucosaminidase domain-containing protein [Selenomonadaceae bacterium]
MPRIISAAIAFLLVAASFVAANPIPIRGVIEGFYGQPWSHQQRLELMSFCREHNLNAYIYAPKDDPYHRAQWREPYPDDQLERLRELIGAADRNGVEFIFAVSPGLDLDYSDADIQSMLDKLSSVYDLGCRR